MAKRKRVSGVIPWDAPAAPPPDMRTRGELLEYINDLENSESQQADLHIEALARAEAAEAEVARLRDKLAEAYARLANMQPLLTVDQSGESTIDEQLAAGQSYKPQDVADLFRWLDE